MKQAAMNCIYETTYVRRVTSRRHSKNYAPGLLLHTPNFSLYTSLPPTSPSPQLLSGR